MNILRLQATKSKLKRRRLGDSIHSKSASRLLEHFSNFLNKYANLLLTASGFPEHFENMRIISIH